MLRKVIIYVEDIALTKKQLSSVASTDGLLVKLATFVKRGYQPQALHYPVTPEEKEERNLHNFIYKVFSGKLRVLLRQKETLLQILQGVPEFSELENGKHVISFMQFVNTYGYIPRQITAISVEELTDIDRLEKSLGTFVNDVISNKIRLTAEQMDLFLKAYNSALPFVDFYYKRFGIFFWAGLGFIHANELQ